MSIIALEGMTFRAYHGCMKEEQVTGNMFRVDLYLDADTIKPEITDQLADTVDYSKAYKIVKEEMNIPSKLLEHVGRRILNAVKANFPAIDFAEVKVSKINPPVAGQTESVSVTISEYYE